MACFMCTVHTLNSLYDNSSLICDIKIYMYDVCIFCHSIIVQCSNVPVGLSNFKR